MFRLAVCADTVFRDLPFEQRAKEIAREGFLVDIWGWKGRDVEALASDPKIRINGMTGYIAGSIVHPDGLKAFLAGVEETLAVAKKLRCRELVISTGEIN